ncbi:MAG: T9SS type A sorting domain-containing protein, partial [Flavobacteriales bacterium]|nr:T9SS type A sorting domain-containing protein [Flavobacteriales bacterium]
LQVLDAQGQVLRTELMHGNAHVLDLSEAAAGVYAVRVRTAQGGSGRATVVVQP